MARKSILKKRAEQLADTRRQIEEATVELRGTVGPASTTPSMIAKRAGVQRHAPYAHFRDDRDLFVACSSLALERDSLPDAAPWAEIPDIRARLRQGISALYGWYARNERLMACVLRDAEHHALTREITEMRFGPAMAAFRRVLGAGLGARQRALLAVALNFYAWQALAGEGGLSPAGAVEVMVDAVASAARVHSLA